MEAEINNIKKDIRSKCIEITRGLQLDTSEENAFEVEKICVEIRTSNIAQVVKEGTKFSGIWLLTGAEKAVVCENAENSFNNALRNGIFPVIASCAGSIKTNPTKNVSTLIGIIFFSYSFVKNVNRNKKDVKGFIFCGVIITNDCGHIKSTKDDTNNKGRFVESNDEIFTKHNSNNLEEGCIYSFPNPSKT